MTVISCYYGYWAFLGECDCRFAVLCCYLTLPSHFLTLSPPLFFLYLPPMAAVKLLIWSNIYLLFCSPAEGSSCGLNTGGPQSPEWRPHLCRSTHQHGCPSLERPHPPGTVTNWKLSLLLLQTSFASVILITYSYWRRKSIHFKINFLFSSIHKPLIHLCDWLMSVCWEQKAIGHCCTKSILKQLYNIFLLYQYQLLSLHSHQKVC